MISLLYAEGDYQEKLKRHMQDMIGEISLEKLEAVIQTILKKQGIKITDYSMNNIVLHFAISIERIRQGNVLDFTTGYRLEQDSAEYYLTQEITELLRKEYHIEFTTMEIQQLSLLFVGLQNEYLTNTNENELSSFVEDKIITALQESLDKVKKMYLIDLQTPKLFNKLAIHLQSLYDRSQYERYTRNTGLLDIKTAYPLVYDIAVYISMLIQDKLSIWFNDDEISFIALHIGVYLESCKDDGPEVKLVVEIDRYYNIEEVITQKLKKQLNENISVQLFDSKKTAVEDYDVYLTTRERAAEMSGAIYVHPILTRKDIELIEKRIRLKKKSIWRKRMFDLIDSFIVEHLYFNQFASSTNTPKSIRKKMVEQMVKYDVIDQSFEIKMEKKEELSSTSFPSGIAVPHFIEQNANKSGISILTLQDYLKWDGYSVNLVALVAISQTDSKDFSDFFETFIEVVSDPINVRQLAHSDSFEEFVIRLKTMIGNEE
ncbi:BglG family transcription antiterminator [Enterococcus olivae]